MQTTSVTNKKWATGRHVNQAAIARRARAAQMDVKAGLKAFMGEDINVVTERGDFTGTLLCVDQWGGITLDLGMEAVDADITYLPYWLLGPISLVNTLS